jgi:hypothetical protein
MLPSTVTQLLITLTFVVPGFVYQSVRITFRGRLPTDVELSTRLVRAIVTSAISALVYLAACGGWILDTAVDEDALIKDIRWNAAYAFAGGFAIPAAAAAVAGLMRVPDRRPFKTLQSKLAEIPRYDSTATAWDKVFQNREPAFIRILNSEGRWIAGYFGTDSYATSYPEAHEVFLERGHHIDENGVIGDEIAGSQGCIVNCVDLQLLEVLAPATDEEGTDA